MEGLFTGDLGRLGRDSAIYFSGRKGDYCKRSGKRFTLGEMETAIERIVKARINKSAGSSEVDPDVKVCCIESNGEFDALVSGICDKDLDLKSICVEELPSHLLPNRFHKISAIPITGNGKVDREKLRAMAKSKGMKLTIGNGSKQSTYV